MESVPLAPEISGNFRHSGKLIFYLTESPIFDRIPACFVERGAPRSGTAVATPARAGRHGLRRLRRHTVRRAPLLASRASTREGQLLYLG